MKIFEKELMERLLEFKNRWDRGYHSFNTEECKEIINLSDKILKIQPNKILAWIVRGYAYFKQFDVESVKKAKECFKKVLELNPKEPEGWLGLSRVYLFRLNNENKGIEFLEKASEVDPSNVWIWGEIADTYHNIDNVKKAIEWFEKIVNETPDQFNNEEIWSILGKLYSRLPEEDVELNIDSILSQGEGPTIEFKSSLRWDTRTERINKELEYVIAKEISGFLNTGGGIILIGVDDNRNIIGLENDYSTFKKKDKDGFSQKLVQILSKYLGNEYGEFWNIKFKKINDKEICVIEVKKSPEPVYTKKKVEEEFFIRKGTSTRPLTIREAHKYINHHWLKYRI